MKRTRRPGPPVTMLSGFNLFRFPPEVILLAVRWHLRYGLSTVARAARPAHRASAGARRRNPWSMVRPSSQVQVAEAGGLQGGDVPLAGVLLGVDVPGHGQPAADFFDGSEPVLVAPRVEAVEKERGVLDAVA